MAENKQSAPSAPAPTPAPAPKPLGPKPVKQLDKVEKEDLEVIKDNRVEPKIRARPMPTPFRSPKPRPPR